MPPQARWPARKIPLFKLAAAAVVFAVGAVLVLRGFDLRALAERAMTTIRSAGAVPFFCAVALLPVIGAPISPFSIVAGEAFGPQLTLPGVIVATLVAITVNLALTYWLARYALRPALSALAARYGWTIPAVKGDNALSITLILRLTPGPPFFVQNYILGLAEVPLRLYMIASILCVIPWQVAFIVLGKGIFKGDFKLVGTAVCALIAVSVFIQWARRRFASKPA